MTANELIDKFNNEFGLSTWPETYEVDANTYANVCQLIFESKLDYDDYMSIDKYRVVNISLGKHGGIIYRNVELILVK